MTSFTGNKPALHINGITGLQELAGRPLGMSGWHLVEQGDVDTFGAVTHDEQWIHTDPVRAAADSPFGGTIQHGFLTLALASGLLWKVCTVGGFSTVVNYGLDRVRFPSPVRVGSRLRLHVVLKEVQVLTAGAAQAVYHLSFEVEGAAKPACVADLIFRYYP